MPDKKFKVTTDDFYYAAALVNAGYKIINITTIDGQKKKGLVSFESDKKIPAFSDFNLIYNDSKISLQEFSIILSSLKKQIFKTIDKEYHNWRNPHGQ